MEFAVISVNVSVTTSAAESTSTGCNVSNVSAHSDGYANNPYILSWYFKVIYVVMFAAMVVVAAGGNLIVIWIVLGHRRMRTVTNYFLVNLAVADSLITVFNTMFNFIYMLNSDWPFGTAYCKFSQFISPCTITASVFTFMAIAVERYVVIIHPLKPRPGARTVLAVIAVIWASAVAIAFPNLPYATTYTWNFCDGSHRTVCYLDWPDGPNKKTDFWYTTTLLLVNYLVPLAALGITYTIVGVELWGSKAIGERTTGQDESAKSKRKIVKMMIIIVLIFAACWLPQHICYFVINSQPEILDSTWSQHLYLVIYWLAMSNAMYNPIIYCWMNARFQSGFKYALRWLPCVRWHPSDAFGFWGFTAVRTCSVTDQPGTRCSTLAASSSAAGVGRRLLTPPGCVSYELTEGRQRTSLTPTSSASRRNLVHGAEFTSGRVQQSSSVVSHARPSPLLQSQFRKSSVTQYKYSLGVASSLE